MTLKEAIQSNSTLETFSDNAIIRAFLDRGVNDVNLTYSVSSLKIIELITADLYLQVITSPDFKEGTLSISYDREYLLNYVKNIANKYNDDTLLNASGLSDLGAIESIELW